METNSGVVAGKDAVAVEIPEEIVPAR